MYVVNARSLIFDAGSISDRVQLNHFLAGGDVLAWSLLEDMIGE